MDSEMLPLFAETVLHLMRLKRTAKRGAKRSYDELLNLAIRKVDEVAPLNVSMAAATKAQELNLRDLRSYCYWCPEMSTKDGNGERVFFWEHFYQVSDARRDIEAFGDSASVEQVLSVLSRMGIVWVLRSEARALGRRPRVDPGAHYLAKGVATVHSWDRLGPSECTLHWK